MPSRRTCSRKACALSSLPPLLRALLLCREKAAGMYSPLPFAIAQGNVELPYLLVQVGAGGAGVLSPAIVRPRGVV